MRVSGRQLAAAAAVWALTTGCCASRQRAAEIDDALRRQNIDRAEPVMLDVAQRQGATLLPNRPLGLGFTPLCGETGTTLRSGRYCVLLPEQPISVTGSVGDAYQLLDSEGERHFAITLGASSEGARLATRDKRLLLLTPEITLHQIDKRAQCECNGGPVVLSMSGFVDLGFAFLLDDLPMDSIKRVSVPIVNDDIEWQCKVFLVRNDRGPRPAIAFADPRPCFRVAR